MPEELTLEDGVDVTGFVAAVTGRGGRARDRERELVTA
jgi:hypothetical protein